VPPYVARHHHFAAQMHVARLAAHACGAAKRVGSANNIFEVLSLRGASRAPRLARLASRGPRVFPRLLPLRTRFFTFPRAAPVLSNATLPRAPHRPLHRLIPSTQPASCPLCSTPSSPSIPRAAPVSSTATLPRAPPHPHRRSPRAASSPSTQPARRPIDVVLRLLPIDVVLRLHNSSPSCAAGLHKSSSYCTSSPSSPFCAAGRVPVLRCRHPLTAPPRSASR
jgi:hypothetical protein